MESMPSSSSTQLHPPVEFDLAEIGINIDGTQADITVAVTDGMGTDALLGQDIPFINQIRKPLVDKRSKKEIPICSVQTRKETVKQQQQIADADQASAQSDATVILWHQLDGLDTDMIVPTEHKMKISRSMFYRLLP